MCKLSSQRFFLNERNRISRFRIVVILWMKVKAWQWSASRFDRIEKNEPWRILFFLELELENHEDKPTTTEDKPTTSEEKSILTEAQKQSFVELTILDLIIHYNESNHWRLLFISFICYFHLKRRIKPFGTSTVFHLFLEKNSLRISVLQYSSCSHRIPIEWRKSFLRWNIKHDKFLCFPPLQYAIDGKTASCVITFYCTNLHEENIEKNV